ncbi:hypothetical protein AKJ08_2352 [Vulgatibacter incomptus]|uniref:Type I restriction enzyme R protein N-terminal domain-containing protein n=2 Tax=Vulgatibacter incomptus TaxID=1391653 RepID=A0A0K1PEM3_9BACT|nr:type I restriction enzyme HsdR N-terminal domain-containing protein [Vulgatibacter incomptus]AKU91965.1 hypothetical protein AKJ08_2352 [Vulgatibacter incomptus]
MLELVARFRENREFIQNEETVKVALVLPLIKMLGYDPATPREVRPEYSAEFTQGDGKKLADRMDFAIFDKTGTKPLLVIETKPLGTDLKAKSQQLARYIAQMSELHFGIITDGCSYLLYGDLENPNQMDRDPFFSFSLDDPEADWGKIAKFLTKFSRDAFNAETLVTDAENSRYRQEMIDRLSRALKSPADDEAFLSWLTKDVYKGKRTTSVMVRLAEVAREAIEPALVRLMSDEFLNKLKERIQSFGEGSEGDVGAPSNVFVGGAPSVAAQEHSPERTKRTIETTSEELEFFDLVRSVCQRGGFAASDIVYRDTVNYFNVSFQKPTKWFVRFFGNGKRKSIVTWVPVDEAKALCPGFEVEGAPDVFGVSRVYVENVAQVWAVSGLVLRSLGIMRTKSESEAEFATVTA